MALKFVCALLLCSAAYAMAGPRVKRGACISMCDIESNSCPSGQECRSNGCGHECYDMTKTMAKRGACISMCDIGSNSCPSGQECKSNGCGHECYDMTESIDKRGSCISFCGGNGVTCPDMYECRSNGCGHQCYRGANYSQNKDCPMYKCSSNCELGYKKDKNGCETCTCDYSLLETLGK